MLPWFSGNLARCLDIDRAGIVMINLLLSPIGHPLLTCQVLLIKPVEINCQWQWHTGRKAQDLINK